MGYSDITFPSNTKFLVTGRDGFIVSNLDNGDIVKKYYLSIFLNQVNL